MIRAGLLALVLARPAAAEETCSAAWHKASKVLDEIGLIRGTVRQDGDWCLVQGVSLDLEGRYLPDWHADRLRFRGPAVGWLITGEGAPDGLDVSVEGLRLVVETGHAQTDWLMAAQARANAIQAEVALSWTVEARELRLERLTIDFPGDNLVEGSMVATGVDLSSAGAMQMSLGSFALSAADLRVRTHGLFEGFLLMPLGTALLPPEGDMSAAVDAIRTDLISRVVKLPASSVPDRSKDALVALVMELPNPSGELTVSLRAEPGIGPGRLVGPALTGVRDTVVGASPLLQGVEVDVGWTHTDAP